ncbi:unnamed protein product [Durusdinium trenchii]|uniref:Inosine/uridine-preferring nucleoside hydrolase domain-containing protein n=1 Tax=Durusdinium trenchii TaxID=1381693 RepID=A0ABP0LJ93_9DINO
MPVASRWLLLCIGAHAQESAAGCRYFHETACAAEPFRSFFQEWRKKTECWLCNNQELVLSAKEVLKDFLYVERPEIPSLGQDLELHGTWKETCLAGFLLALFATTRSQSVQPWRFYDVGLSLINSCAFDEATFYARHGITTAQVAYNFYVLGLPYHLPDPVLHLQAAELSDGMHRQDAPLVIDVGMGLGADSRYYLSQGFRVVAVEANRKAIEVAMTIDWVKPLVTEPLLGGKGRAEIREVMSPLPAHRVPSTTRPAYVTSTTLWLDAMALWLDADPSGLTWTGLDCDDDLALLCAVALERRGLSGVQITGLSICGGNAPLSHTWPNALQLLQSISSDWKIFKGAGWRRMRPAWASLRLLSSLIVEDDADDAAEALAAAAKGFPPKELSVLMLGPATNLAIAFRRFPWLAQHLKRVVLMGGELTGRRLDLNFMSDRAAAREVISAGVGNLTLVPIQTCAQVSVTAEFLRRLETCPASAARAVLPKMWLQTWLMPSLVNRRVQLALKGWPASSNLDRGFIPWDVVALMATLRPDSFDQWERLHVSFPPCELEPCNGTMSISSSTADGGPVWVPKVLRNETLFLEEMLDMLCSVPMSGPKPTLQWGFLVQAVAAPGQGGRQQTIFAFDERPEQSNAQPWVEELGGKAESVRTVECADLLRVFGQPVYMKIDVESSTIDCLDSLVHAAGSRAIHLPKFISMELEAASLFERFYVNLKGLGYLYYKACRQYIYSPAPCEQGRYSREVPGCGSGPFGTAAVDYQEGLRWKAIDRLPSDRQWVEEFERGLDWFDLHAMRPT